MPLRPFPVHDSLVEYELARTERIIDGLHLAIEERHYGSIYLLGYVIEMILKIAYFRVRGYGPAQPITLDERRGAEDEGRRLGLQVATAGFHSPVFWAELLIRYRASTGREFGSRFSDELRMRAEHIHQNWAFNMRYHHRPVDREDFILAWEAVFWFEQNAEKLWR